MILFGVALMVFGVLLVAFMLTGVRGAWGDRDVSDLTLIGIVVIGGGLTALSGSLHIINAGAEDGEREALARCIAHHDEASARCACCTEGNGYMFDAEIYTCIEVGSTLRHDNPPAHYDSAPGAIYSCAEKSLTSFMTESEAEFWRAGEEMIRDIYGDDGGAP